MNKLPLFIIEKRKEIIFVEVGIANQDLVQAVGNEKKRKYDIPVNKLELIYKFLQNNPIRANLGRCSNKKTA